MGSFAFEKHYRVRELAGLWGLSAKTVTRMFAEEAGVIRVANDGTGKRKYATLSIPESVALRVHERLGNQPFQATLAGGHPLRIIRLGDLHAGVSKKPRQRHQAEYPPSSLRTANVSRRRWGRQSSTPHLSPMVCIRSYTSFAR